LLNIITSEKRSLNYFYLLKKIVELRAEHTRWSGALTLFISIFVASLIALLSTFIELQSPNLLSDTKYDPEKIIIKGDSLNIILVDSIIINKLGHGVTKPESCGISQDTVKIKKFKFNYVEERSESKYKTSANQILLSGTSVLSLIFTLFIYIIRRKVELQLEEIENDKKYKYMFLTDLSDSIYIDLSDNIHKNSADIDKEIERIKIKLKDIDEELGCIDSNETLDVDEKRRKNTELESER